MRLLMPMLLVSAALLPAQTPQPKKDTAGGDPMVDYFRSLADYYHLDERSVYTIRDKVGQPELIAPVMAVAKHSSASPNQVIDAVKSGKDWPAITRQWKVKTDGGDWVEQANTRFLADYHGRTAEDVRKLRQKGLDWVAINQEFRRDASVPTTSSRRTRR
jgi:hypothetical protein